MIDFNLIQDYIQELIGTPYVWWKEGDIISSAPPFWAKNSKPPSVELIKKSGSNCAGFINLICRFVNIYIPGISMNLEYAGGTYIWYEYLKDFGLLERFRIEHNYPPGTLLLRNYSNELDQGHIAIVLDNCKLAHCFPDKGITIDESYYESHNWFPDGYYTDICLPKNWLYNKQWQIN
jgi:cell wall-associated NlpC family hydrolase